MIYRTIFTLSDKDSGVLSRSPTNDTHILSSSRRNRICREKVLRSLYNLQLMTILYITFFSKKIAKREQKSFFIQA